MNENRPWLLSRISVGDRTVDELITIGRQDIEIEALARMQELSKRYHLGIRVDQVQLKNVNPPSQVQASFNEVNKAQQDRENAINIAKGEYNKVVPKAKGEADQCRQAKGSSSGLAVVLPLKANKHSASDR